MLPSKLMSINILRFKNVPYDTLSFCWMTLVVVCISRKKVITGSVSRFVDIGHLFSV